MAKFSFRWGIEILDDSHTSIPNMMFDYYYLVPWVNKDGNSGTGISNTEWAFIGHLARYRYETEKSKASPSLTHTIRVKMGFKSNQGVINVQEKLEHKKLLTIKRQRGKRSEYNFSNFSKRILLIALQNDPDLLGGQGDQSTKFDSSTKLDSDSSTKLDSDSSTKLDSNKKVKEENSKEEKNTSKTKKVLQPEALTKQPPTLSIQAEFDELMKTYDHDPKYISATTTTCKNCKLFCEFGERDGKTLHPYFLFNGIMKEVSLTESTYCSKVEFTLFGKSVSVFDEPPTDSHLNQHNPFLEYIKGASLNQLQVMLFQAINYLSGSNKWDMSEDFSQLNFYGISAIDDLPECIIINVTPVGLSEIRKYLNNICSAVCDTENIKPGYLLVAINSQSKECGHLLTTGKECLICEAALITKPPYHSFKQIEGNDEVKVCQVCNLVWEVGTLAQMIDDKYFLNDDEVFSDARIHCSGEPGQVYQPITEQPPTAPTLTPAQSVKLMQGEGEGFRSYIVDSHNWLDYGDGMEQCVEAGCGIIRHGNQGSCDYYHLIDGELTLFCDGDDLPMCSKITSDSKLIPTPPQPGPELSTTSFNLDKLPIDHNWVHDDDFSQCGMCSLVKDNVNPGCHYLAIGEELEFLGFKEDFPTCAQCLEMVFRCWMIVMGLIYNKFRSATAPATKTITAEAIAVKDCSRVSGGNCGCGNDEDCPFESLAPQTIATETRTKPVQEANNTYPATEAKKRILTDSLGNYELKGPYTSEILKPLIPDNKSRRIDIATFARFTAVQSAKWLESKGLKFDGYIIDNGADFRADGGGSPVNCPRRLETERSVFHFLIQAEQFFRLAEANERGLSFGEVVSAGLAPTMQEITQEIAGLSNICSHSVIDKGECLFCLEKIYTVKKPKEAESAPVASPPKIITLEELKRKKTVPATPLKLTTAPQDDGFDFVGGGGSGKNNYDPLKRIALTADEVQAIADGVEMTGLSKQYPSEVVQAYVYLENGVNGFKKARSLFQGSPDQMKIGYTIAAYALVFNRYPVTASEWGANMLAAKEHLQHLDHIQETNPKITMLELYQKAYEMHSKNPLTIKNMRGVDHLIGEVKAELLKPKQTQVTPAYIPRERPTQKHYDNARAMGLSKPDALDHARLESGDSQWIPGVASE